MVATFDDGKEDGALRTIGAVGEALGIKTHVLRYWEGQFPMLKPLKRTGGRRYYRPEDVALVQEIDRLVNREGYTLRGARAAIEGPSAARGVGPPSGLPQLRPSPAVGNEASPAIPADAIAKLKSVRAALAAALAA